MSEVLANLEQEEEEVLSVHLPLLISHILRNQFKFPLSHKSVCSGGDCAGRPKCGSARFDASAAPGGGVGRCAASLAPPQSCECQRAAALVSHVPSSQDVCCQTDEADLNSFIAEMYDEHEGLSALMEKCSRELEVTRDLRKCLLP